MHGTTASTMHCQAERDADRQAAIIGMGCRLPGDANTMERFWELIVHGRSAWSEVPPERWNKNAYYHPNRERKGTVSSQPEGGLFKIYGL